MVKPNFKNNKKIYLIAWFYPAILIVLGAGVYYLVFPSHFDLSMSNIYKINTRSNGSYGSGSTISRRNKIIAYNANDNSSFTCTYIIL